jgi:DeoR/GlpR family transcriptional regulator of sugar metabolism
MNLEIPTGSRPHLSQNFVKISQLQILSNYDFPASGCQCAIPVTKLIARLLESGRGTHYNFPVSFSHSKRKSRVAELCKFLKERSSATYGELADHFAVSEMTMRRDVGILAATGQVLIVPRGVQTARGFLAELPFLERIQRMGHAKDLIGRTAAELVTEGSSVVLDSGTTTLQVAHHLRDKHCTVITMSLSALQELADSATVRVEMIGGVYRSSSQDVVGPQVYQALSGVRADRVIFGAAAISLSGDVMVNDSEAALGLVRAGRHRVLAVDSSKLGAEALYRFCELGQCDLMITDEGAKDSDLEQLRKYTKIQIARAVEN